MRAKKALRMLMACVLAIGCVAGNAGAIYERNDEAAADLTLPLVLDLTRASGSFNMDIPARTKKVADSSFPLSAGETVRIYAVYSPNVSVDFGLVDDDGVYHYINVTNGIIDKTILISERGNYTLQIRNNSSQTVKVSGFVQY